MADKKTSENNTKETGKQADKRVNPPQPGPKDWKKADEAIRKLDQDELKDTAIEITGWDDNGECPQKNALSAIKESRLDLRYIDKDDNE